MFMQRFFYESAYMQFVFIKAFVCIDVYQCVFVLSVVTSITQCGELQSVKSTLTFMLLTSQGRPKAEHLDWSVTFQTENNNRVFEDDFSFSH